MRKRILMIVVACLIVLLLPGCSNNAAKASVSQSTDPAAAEQTEEAEQTDQAEQAAEPGSAVSHTESGSAVSDTEADSAANDKETSAQAQSGSNKEPDQPGTGAEEVQPGSGEEQTQSGADDAPAAASGSVENDTASGSTANDTASDYAANDTASGSAANDTETSSAAQAAEDAKEISIKDIESIYIGQTEDAKAGTGCTVFISKDGMPAGLDVRGGGPASRESELLDPLASAQTIHAIVLAGGSAYGLGAANGVMEYLEDKGIGYDTGVAKVPLVVQSDLFDLAVGDPSVRPDAKMGHEAARLAMEESNYKDGNYGAGCGATVGKIAGMDTCMKTGIGSYAIQIGDLQIGAVVAVNSLGDVLDWKTGRKIAGLLTPDKKGFRDTIEYMAQSTAVKDNKFTGNTTLGVVITNASFDKSQLCKIAGMAHDGFARSINPVHTSADGDSIYAVSTGSVEADQDLVGVLSAVVMSEAIKRAVFSADSAYGFISAKDLGISE